ncbi:probable sugar phosphate/phosphate translocator At1g06470 [Aristolochia californica]|uniref:probable sugar phosphate/phosphate translocator At1g06470 n=1 Tax=Aristolochia californica TaxID=171875 RepID=UPI0035DFAECE
MIEGSLETKNGGSTGVNEVDREISEPVLRREPSFSRWYDENENEDHPPDSYGESIEDCDFELPLLQEKFPDYTSTAREKYQSLKSRQDNMHLNKNGLHATGISLAQFEEKENGQKYVPFDIEDMTSDERHLLGLANDTAPGKLETAQAAKDNISLATVLKTLCLILLWYTSSTCLTLYNKTLLGENIGHFPAPMLMNTVHFSMQAVLSKIIILFSQRLRPEVEMSWKDYFLRVVPTAIGTALDINLSNASLVFISVTFATMCKSAAPIFLLMFAFAFRLESPSIKLFGIIIIISVGVLLTVAREAEFELWGFIFVMLASVMSGFRWSMTQILLQKETYGLKHPITLMSYVTPIMAMTTALCSLVMDPWHKFKGSHYFNSSWHVFQSCLLMIVGGSLAFLMVLIEYILVSETSAVTVTIAGVVKEAVTILVAVFYFHDQFTVLKGIGLFTIMVGVSLFNWYKYLNFQKSVSGGNNEETVSLTNGTGKYVILEDIEDQDDDI